MQSLLATGTGDIGQSDSVSASASASAKMSLGDFFGFLSASTYLLSASRELALGTSDDVERCSYAVINQVNKDHQRMMIDSMFMIVQSLRSFLTAVTPTVVAPIAVILPVFTQICVNLPEFT